MSNVISIQSVTKRFGENVLFDQASLDVAPGRIYSLAGPNGSGKSVLLKMICGFVRPDAGEIVVAPEFLSKNRTFPEHFGVTIDGPAYVGGLTGIQNLLELASIRGEIDNARIVEVMEAVGLSPFAKQRVRNYSLGMKQKLSLAQALMENPRVLLLDEPFNALDIDSTNLVKAILRSERENGTTILFTSHSQQDIEDLSDFSLVLNAGKLTPA
jgi:ABC-2 type transport system ATP-binding protein